MKMSKLSTSSTGSTRFSLLLKIWASRDSQYIDNNSQKHVEGVGPVGFGETTPHPYCRDASFNNEREWKQNLTPQAHLSRAPPVAKVNVHGGTGVRSTYEMSKMSEVSALYAQIEELKKQKKVLIDGKVTNLLFEWRKIDLRISGLREEIRLSKRRRADGPGEVSPLPIILTKER